MIINFSLDKKLIVERKGVYRLTKKGMAYLKRRSEKLLGD